MTHTTRIDIIPRAGGKAHLTWWDWGAGYYAVLEGRFEDGTAIWERIPPGKWVALSWVLRGKHPYWWSLRATRWGARLTDNVMEIVHIYDHNMTIPIPALAPVIARIKEVRGG